VRVAHGEKEKITVRRYISELQSDVCQSHERVARAWLTGQDIDISCRNRKRGELPKITEDNISDQISFSPDVVAGLWGSIYGAIHSGYLNTAEWKPGTRISRSFYDGMRNASAFLLAKLIRQLTMGPIHQCQISAQNRIGYLSENTNRQAKLPEWPAPANEMPSPQTGPPGRTVLCIILGDC
jgi:hypothetical protein